MFETAPNTQPLTRDEHGEAFMNALEFFTAPVPAPDAPEEVLQPYMARYKRLVSEDFLRLWTDVARLQAALPAIEDLELVRDLMQKREDLELNKHAVPRMNRIIDAVRKVSWNG